MNEKLISILKQAVPNVFVSSIEPPDDYEDCGTVSGYSIIGTGPISEFFASVTDFFGIQSGSYAAKLKYAEEQAINMMRLEALKRGADSIYCCDIKVTEATSGKGMLIINVSGSAILSGDDDPHINIAIKAIADFYQKSKEDKNNIEEKRSISRYWG